MTAAIETQSLSVSFSSVQAVKDLDLKVEQGEVFGFLGPNGAGKTTTIRMLLDLLRPNSGRALLFGEEVRAGGGKLRSRVGFLPGDLSLLPDLSGAAILDLFAQLYRRDPIRREEVLGTLGLEREALGRKIKTYSTGMRQMIGITLAFQHDPDLLILDEPTTGLDPVAREAFLSLVRGERDRGRTVFLSSHVLDEVERSADRVAMLDHGRLLMVDSVDAIRRERPRKVALRFKDGSEKTFTHAGSPAELLAELEADQLLDLVIRPAGLDEVFKSLVRRGTES